ncbi:MAG: MBL fold metallo-hydrolase [Clostridia bacterium]|nr:MBL fold metallo-hydrolase [Clostridia bacterium]
MSFEKEIGEIYRLKVPFDDLYTSVFLIQTESANVLVDSATTPQDVEVYILPALRERGIAPDYLLLTHNHGDHAGGKDRILQAYPGVKLILEGVNGLIVYELKGHTLDSIGVLDERSGTLISGDGLQGYGVGKYRCSLVSREEYIKTIEKIRQDKRIENILFSHAYEPWKKSGAFGRKAIEKILDDCKKEI